MKVGAAARRALSGCCPQVVLSGSGTLSVGTISEALVFLSGAGDVRALPNPPPERSRTSPRTLPSNPQPLPSRAALRSCPSAAGAPTALAMCLRWRCAGDALAMSDVPQPAPGMNENEQMICSADWCNASSALRRSKGGSAAGFHRTLGTSPAVFLVFFF